MDNPFDDLAAELPDGPFWPTGKWFKRLLAALVADRFRAGTNLDEIPTIKGRFVNAQAGGANASDPTPWQLSASPWLGVGADPYAATRTMRYRIGDGAVNDGTPTNMITEFVAFGDPSNATATEAEAVVTLNYWQANIVEIARGSGVVTIGAPTIMQAQGGPQDSLRTLIGAPAIDPATGALPSYIVGQINKVSYWGGTCHFLPGLRSYQSIGVFLAGELDGVVGRGIVYCSQDGGLSQ